jgi:hypothetical protein
MYLSDNVLDLRALLCRSLEKCNSIDRESHRERERVHNFESEIKVRKKCFLVELIWIKYEIFVWLRSVRRLLKKCTALQSSPVNGCDYEWEAIRMWIRSREECLIGRHIDRERGGQKSQCCVSVGPHLLTSHWAMKLLTAFTNEFEFWTIVWLYIDCSVDYSWHIWGDAPIHQPRIRKE